MIDKEIRLCGNCWTFCDGDCAHCENKTGTYASNHTEPVSQTNFAGTGVTRQ